MREIKFRVWDISNQEFIKDASDFWINPYNFKTFMEWRPEYDGKLVFEPEKELFVFQQYTGLKDANDKEIYEGDIIQVYEYDSDNTNPMYKAEIFFDEEDAQFVAREINRTYTLIIGNSAFCDINVFCCEVIGNIYETKL